MSTSSANAKTEVNFSFALSTPHGWMASTSFLARSLVSTSLPQNIVCLDEVKWMSDVPLSSCSLPMAKQQQYTDGLDVVDKIEEVGSQSGATAKPVVVKESGEILD